MKKRQQTKEQKEENLRNTKLIVTALSNLHNNDYSDRYLAQINSSATHTDKGKISSTITVTLKLKLKSKETNGDQT